MAKVTTEEKSWLLDRYQHLKTWLQELQRAKDQAAAYARRRLEEHDGRFAELEHRISLLEDFVCDVAQLLVLVSRRLQQAGEAVDEFLPRIGRCIECRRPVWLDYPGQVPCCPSCEALHRARLMEVNHEDD